MIAIFSTGSAADSIALDGEWKFGLDPQGQGVEEAWASRNLEESITLPGSTDEAGYGDPLAEASNMRLNRKVVYAGAAWYQRRVEIPEAWKGNRIELVLERCHWETRVWVDGQEAGPPQNSLSVAQRHDLTKLLTPGEHLLTIRVDNSVKINIGHSQGNMQWAHAITDETQTNWNGIIGEITLEAHDPVWIESIQVYPDVEAAMLQARVRVHNSLEEAIAADLGFVVRDASGKALCKHKIEVRFEPGESLREIELELGADMKTWSELSPHLYVLQAELDAITASITSMKDRLEVRFGMRDLGIEGQLFTLNGERIFLRGTLDCCIWPLTGYPPMDREAWLDYLGTLKEYGHNHLRFHSWCPPEAAFQAADELGFLFQVECPYWDGYGHPSGNPELVEFLRAEFQRILEAYGNHPSFGFFSIGNELGHGNDPLLAKLVALGQETDPRHFYTCTTHPYDGSRIDDYFVSAATDRGGCRGIGAGALGWANDADHSAPLAHLKRPLIAHEIGQYCMFPDFEEMEKYTGVLEPKNFQIFKDSMQQSGLLDQAEDFRRATGAFILRLYKEEYEKMFRTENLAGFQTLGLQDFPGQGSTYIGFLDAFLDSKGILTADEHRRFLGQSVLLLRMPKRQWLDGETFKAKLEISHHGEKDIAPLNLRWRLEDDTGATLRSGLRQAGRVERGGLRSLGALEIPLEGLPAAARYRIVLESGEPALKNAWDFWLWPGERDMPDPGKVLVLNDWEDGALAALEQGASVLLLPSQGRIASPIPPNSFISVFWNLRLFPGQPGTMGLFCDPTHPVFDGFPTDFHSDWQWGELLNRYKPIVLDKAPRNYRPLVQIIDDYGRNHRLAAVMECRVGPGRLLVSAIDLRKDLEQRPVARQFLVSLLDYMESDEFDPETSLDPEYLAQIFTAESVRDAGAPKDLERAVVDVRAATDTVMNTNMEWKPERDTIEKMAAGFGYRLCGLRCWRDEGGTAWHGTQPQIVLECPERFEGMAYYHFGDWNNQGRRGHVYFEGRDRGPLEQHNGSGLWMAEKVNAEDSADGLIEMRAECRSGPNLMVSRVVLIPAE